MTFQRPVDHGGLVVHALPVETGSRARPVGAVTTKEGSAKGRRHGRVADPHVADQRHIRLLHRFETRPEGIAGLGFGHRRFPGDVSGRSLE